jgi:hypothetical protein
LAKFLKYLAGGTMSTNADQPKSQLNSRLNQILIFAAVLVVVFLLGFVPMWLKARSASGERDAVQRQLRLCQLQGALASAVINSRRGEYELARQDASEFFTNLHTQVDAANSNSDLTSQESDALRPLLNDRDNLITLLARSDPASADRLSDLFVSYQKGKPKS